MGRDVTASVPSSTPNCTAIKTALKETANTAGKKRWRPCQRIFSEYNLRMVKSANPSLPARSASKGNSYPCLRRGLAGFCLTHSGSGERCLHPTIKARACQVGRRPRRQLAQTAAAIDVVPELRGNDTH